MAAVGRATVGARFASDCSNPEDADWVATEAGCSSLTAAGVDEEACWGEMRGRDNPGVADGTLAISLKSNPNVIPSKPSASDSESRWSRNTTNDCFLEPLEALPGVATARGDEVGASTGGVVAGCDVE